MSLHNQLSTSNQDILDDEFVYDCQTEDQALFKIYNALNYNQYLAIEDSLVLFVSERGYVRLLQWLKDTNKLQQVNFGENHSVQDIIFYVTQNNSLLSLDWWVNQSQMEFSYEIAIDAASNLGKTNFLQWWKCSQVQFQYTNLSIDGLLNFTVGYGNDEIGLDENIEIQTLQWWVNSGYLLKYSPQAFDYAMCFDHILVILEFWKNNQLEFYCTDKFLENMCDLDNNDQSYTLFIEWFEKFNSSLNQSKKQQRRLKVQFNYLKQKRYFKKRKMY